jgi:hypothetical protein
VGKLSRSYPAAPNLIMQCCYPGLENLEIRTIVQHLSRSPLTQSGLLDVDRRPRS